MTWEPGSPDSALDAFRVTLRRYALDELAPDYARWQDEPFPRQGLVALGELGVFGLLAPPEFGGTLGAGGGYLPLGVAVEEVARGDFNVGYFLQLQAIGIRLLLQSDVPDVRDRWVPALVSGEALASFALTEPGVGSDAAAIATRAVRDGSDWIISGEKSSITFAGNADVCTVFARTGPKGGSGKGPETAAGGISQFCVPLDRPGVTRQPVASSTSHLTERGSLFFDEVRIPADHLIGAEGGGFRSAMAAFDFNRALIALACIGAAQQSLDETMEHTRTRHTFGEPLARRQGVSFQIAEHLAQVHSARLVAYETLRLADEGQKHATEAAMAKWLGPKSSAEAIHACMVLHGWSGFNLELPLSQRLNDVIGLQVGDGTPEIMKAIIAREAIGVVSHR
ncbi:MAG: cyclohexanecarboxyl-CoA dehydrogenase [Actinomycetia bacterium]|nr:cyclohexanecarboxyl-CoA dehydrogenase [Actinomycetes bacterium]